MLDAAPSTGSSHSASDDERNGPLSGSSRETMSMPTSAATHAPPSYFPPPALRAPPPPWSQPSQQPPAAASQPQFSQSPPADYAASFSRTPSLPPFQQPDWANYATQIQLQPMALVGQDMSNLRSSPWPQMPGPQSAVGPYFQPAPASVAHWAGSGGGGGGAAGCAAPQSQDESSGSRSPRLIV